MKTIKGEPLHSYLVADETASIQLCLWGDMGTVLRPGDICELRLGCACTVECSVLACTCAEAWLPREADYLFWGCVSALFPSAYLLWPAVCAGLTRAQVHKSVEWNAIAVYRKDGAADSNRRVRRR